MKVSIDFIQTFKIISIIIRLEPPAKKAKFYRFYENPKQRFMQKSSFFLICVFLCACKVFIY